MLPGKLCFQPHFGALFTGVWSHQHHCYSFPTRGPLVWKSENVLEVKEEKLRISTAPGKFSQMKNTEQESLLHFEIESPDP